MIYRHFALLGVFILAAGLCFLVLRWPQEKTKTFSQHAAMYRHTICYYIGLFAIVLPLLVLFFAKWFAPMLNLSPWFMRFIIASCVAQFACTLIPELMGWREKVHRALAGFSAITLLPPMLIITTTLRPDNWLRYITASCMTIMVVILIVSSKNGGKRIGWMAQASYFTAFFAAILAVTYLS